MCYIWTNFSPKRLARSEVYCYKNSFHYISAVSGPLPGYMSLDPKSLVLRIADCSCGLQSEFHRQTCTGCLVLHGGYVGVSCWFIGERQWRGKKVCWMQRYDFAHLSYTSWTIPVAKQYATWRFLVHDSIWRNGWLITKSSTALCRQTGSPSRMIPFAWLASRYSWPMAANFYPTSVLNMIRDLQLIHALHADWEL